MLSRTCKAWTYKELERCTAMCGKGMTYREIGAALGRGQRSVANAMSRLGVKNAGAPHRARSARFWEYVDACKDRPTRRQLAERLGVTESAVRQYKQRLRKLGMVG